MYCIKLLYINDTSIMNLKKNEHFWKQGVDFPGGTVDKNLPANVGDTGLIPGPGRFHMPQSN